MEDPKEAERLAAQEEERRAAAEREFKMIIKTDMSGSLAAVEKLLSEIPQDEVKAVLIRSSAGILSEADVEFAASANASILGFNMTVPAKARLAAEKAKVPLINFNIVYELLDHVREEMGKLLPRKKIVSTAAEAEVLATFDIKVPGKKLKVAGCRVTSGTLLRKNRVQLIRKGEILYDGAVDTLKHFKEDVLEIKNGQECGIAFEKFTDTQIGDIVRSYTVTFEARKLPEQKRTDVPHVYGQREEKKAE